MYRFMNGYRLINKAPICNHFLRENFNTFGKSPAFYYTIINFVE